MRWIAMLMVVVSLPSLAEDDKARRAREELERELSRTVGAVPTKVRIDFEALDEPNYSLEEANFELDGRGLLSPLTFALAQPGAHLVWNGDVAPGKHTVRARIVYANKTSALLTEEGGHTWKLSGDVTFDIQSGIEVQVRVVPIRDGSQRDVAKRFRLSLPAKPVMLAKLDDGTMPAPVAKPTLDAGAPVVVAAVTQPNEPPAEPTEKEPRADRAPAATKSRVTPRPEPEAPAEGPAPAEAPLAANEPTPVPEPAPPPPIAATPPVEVEKPAAPEVDEGPGAMAYVVGATLLALVLGMLVWSRRRSRPRNFD